MAQETNLNVSPYFDDFNPNKNFYKVLFKPGYPIQARELTSLQSILQNQIESFGNHVFKEGSMVIPGGVNYNSNLIGVQIQPSFNGLQVDSYIDNLLNKDIIGEASGVRAKVIYILKARTEDNPYTVLYLTFKSEGNGFLSGENLLVESTILPGFSNINSINVGQPFCTTINESPTVSGSAIVVNEGVYFIRGYFIQVPSQSLILGWNNILPSYSVGFEILEDIVTADDDESLFDNARGFSNYAAPGADRLQIDAKLTKIDVVENTPNITDKNYVEIFRVVNGDVKRLNRNSLYEELANEFARRTYDESGNYYVKPFTLEVKDSLNNFKGNDGVYKTPTGNVGESVGIYKISPGKAYVHGFEVESLGTKLLEFAKPRTTKQLTNQFINFNSGSTFTLNRVYGVPSLEVDGSYIVSLRDSRVGTSSTIAAGKEIGLARVYDFALESGLYNESTMNLNEWNISLYDIQTYTELVLNEPISLSVPTYIKGRSSGSTAFLRYDASNSGIITAYNINGNFQVGEKLIFDDSEVNSRVSTAITEYGLFDAKSVYGSSVGSAYTFSADIKPSIIGNFGQVSITSKSAGVSTATINDPNVFFNLSIKPGDIVAYNISGLSTSTFSKVISVSDRSLVIAGVTTVNGVCEGNLPQTDSVVNDFYLLKSLLSGSTNNSLFVPFPKQNIESTDLTNSALRIRKEINVSISSNAVVVSPTSLENDEFFEPFDEENYILIREDGEFEPLSSDKFVFSDNNRELTINGLGSDTNARLIATLTKIQVKAKQKNRVKVEFVTIDKSSNPSSGIGASTLNDGLIYGNFPYGTRVQDKELCLNYPDVTKVYAVFESDNVSDPILPSINLINVNTADGTIENLQVGEEFIGLNSLAVGLCVGKINANTLQYVIVNDRSFILGESISSSSGVTGNISQINLGSRNIASSYGFTEGQNNYIYDYSKLILSNNRTSPSKKLLVVLERGEYSSSDTGDITTIDSYRQFNWCDIPYVYDINTGDVVDVRPRVSKYISTEGSRSPLEFLGRSFDSSGSSAKNIIVPNISILLNYSYYLGRTDKIYLSKDNTIQVRQGIPSDNPVPPEPIENALEIATISIPPYMCSTKSAVVTLTEHKRYRMQDIARLENRISSLEYYTTLSLLEKDTSSLTIKDSNGIDRFKSGLFVDNFKSTTYQLKKTDIKNSIDIPKGELRPTHYTTEIDLLLGNNALLNNEDSLQEDYDAIVNNDIVGTGVVRTGISPGSTGKGVITLAYGEVAEITQPYATRVENVTPYFVTIYEGIIDLNPSSDIWIDRTQLTALTVEGITGEVTATTLQLSKQQIDSQAGWSPLVWGSWAEQWAGQ